MERPIFQPVGTPAVELDTPALVVDLSSLEKNIETVHSFFQGVDAKLRPHVARHGCARIAHMQLAAGGTTGGIAVTTVGEAEVFAGVGLLDITIANQVVGPSKLRRLCALAGSASMTVAVDNPRNVADLSQAALSAGVKIDLLVEVDVGMGRCGVTPGAEAVSLARRIAGETGVNFRGLLAVLPKPNPESNAGGLETETRNAVQPVLDTRELLEKEGLPVAAVSILGSHAYDVAGAIPGVTEVIAGTYALMDYNHSRYRSDLLPAAKILAGVISNPVDRMAVLDAGHKATGPDAGLPVLDEVAGISGARATRFSAEHGIVEWDGGSENGFKPGDRAWLVPYDLALTLNQYDYIRAVRNGKLEGFWPMAARGRFN